MSYLNKRIDCYRSFCKMANPFKSFKFNFKSSQKTCSKMYVPEEVYTIGMYMLKYLYFTTKKYFLTLENEKNCKG